MKLRGLGLLGLILMMSVPMVGASYVPYHEEWSVYEFSLESGETQLIYSTPIEITSISLNPDSSTFALSMNLDEGYESSEIFTLNTDGSGFTQLTDNEYWNVYPVWSPDGTELAFLSWRDSSLDIYKMDRDGGNQRLLYDSGGHDADIDWRGDLIVFTRDSQIWVMNNDGSEPRQLTDPPRAGEWGDAVLPFGDYDPRISPDGSLVVFERMVDDSSPHGNYDLYVIGIDEFDERPITDLGWTLGIARWSSSGDELIFLVSAVGLDGRYDVFSINLDGSALTDLTGDLLPPGFLAHSPVYSSEYSSIYFVGQWWDWKVLSSSLSCFASHSVISLGESVIISGSVQPEVHDIDLTLTITGPDGSETSGGLSSEDGSYVYTFTPDALGSWSVQVGWGGDLGHSGAVSEAVGLDVEEEEPDDGGVPGFDLLPVFAGICLFLLYRRDYFSASV